MINLQIETNRRLVEVVPGFLLFAAEEAGQLDLNRDGDGFDAVIHTLDLKRWKLTNLGLATNTFGALAVSASHVWFEVDESSQGREDLNGDGHVGGRLLYYADRRLLSPRMASSFKIQDFHLGGRLLSVDVRESVNEHLDFNGDGDSRDSVLFGVVLVEERFGQR